MHAYISFLVFHLLQLNNAAKFHSNLQFWSGLQTRSMHLHCCSSGRQTLLLALDLNNNTNSFHPFLMSHTPPGWGVSHYGVSTAFWKLLFKQTKTRKQRNIAVEAGTKISETTLGAFPFSAKSIRVSFSSHGAVRWYVVGKNAKLVAQVFKPTPTAMLHTLQHCAGL